MKKNKKKENIQKKKSAATKPKTLEPPITFKEERFSLKSVFSKNLKELGETFPYVDKKSNPRNLEYLNDFSRTNKGISTPGSMSSITKNNCSEFINQSYTTGMNNELNWSNENTEMLEKYFTKDFEYSFSKYIAKRINNLKY